MKIKTIIFDVDDTLLRTSETFFKNMNKVAKFLKLKKLTKQEFLKYWGHTLEKMALLYWPGLTTEKFKQVYNKVAYDEPYPLVEGTKEVLNLLRKKETLLGILTSRTRDTLPKRFAQVNLSLNYFRFIQYSDDTKYHKPDPRVFQPILKKFNKIGIKNNEILYIGDLVFDGEAALKNNMQFLAVLTGTTKKKDFINAKINPKNIINSVEDLPKWLKSKK